MIGNTLEGITIALDVDGVLADLHVAWLKLYNDIYGDDLAPEEIIDWDISKFVKPECGEKIFDLLSTHGLYYQVPVVRVVRWAVDILKGRGAKVIYVTSCHPNTYEQKISWLVRHGFLPNKAVPVYDEFFAANDKSKIRADALVDDRDKNCRDFQGLAVLFDAPWNRNVPPLPSHVHRLEGWTNVVRFLVQQLEWKERESE